MADGHRNMKRLPIEILLSITSKLPAINIRDLCKASGPFYRTIKNHNNRVDVLRGIMNQPYFQLCSTLYPTPNPLSLKYISDIEHSVHTATDISHSLEGQKTPDKTKSLTQRQACRLVLYLLLLGHFFEHYRAGLSNVSFNPHASPLLHPGTGLPLTPSERVERDILLSEYNPETVYNLSITYHWIRQQLEDKFGNPCALLYWHFLNGYEAEAPGADVYIGLLTLGGMAMVKDILAHSEDVAPAYCDAHIARAVGYSAPAGAGWTPSVQTLPEDEIHDLSPSILPQLDRTQVRAICGALPPLLLELQALRVYSVFLAFGPATTAVRTRRFFNGLEFGDGEPSFIRPHEIS